MTDEQDLAFGKAAIDRGYITQQQLDDCLGIAEMVTQAGLKRSLADILVEKSFITEMQAEVLGRATAAADVKVIGGFELLDKLGEGGMGAVYKARQISMDRVVALKLLPDRLARDKEFTARFLREARIAAKLDHVNMVRGIDVGQDGEHYYFAMEYVEGETVGNVLKREGKVTEERALRIATQVTRALAHAWEQTLIHRDIKPDNILLTKDGVAKVADLGLARSTSAESTVMTRTGMAVGTPHYISPEQARGEKDIDIRTDIYSLGATLYHMVVGETPFSGSTAAVIITQHLTESPPAAHAKNPDVSENTGRVIAKMMAKKAEGRHDSPKQLLEDLELVADGKAPKHAPPVAPPQAAVPTVGMGSGLSSGVGLMSEEDFRQFQSQVAVAAAKKWLVPAAIAGGVLAVMLIILIVVLATRGGGLEDQARRELVALQGLVAAGKLDSAYDDAIKAKSLYADTDLADDFAALVKEIEGKQGELEQKQHLEETAAKQTELDAEKQKRGALVAEARAELGKAAVLLVEKDFEGARGTLTASADKVKDAGLEDEAAQLSEKIDAAEKAEADRLALDGQKQLEKRQQEEAAKKEAERKATEAAREKEFAGRVTLGDKRFAERAFKGALEAYQHAAEIKSTPEIERKMQDCLFESGVADGRAAQDRRELELAAEFYQKAIAIREDATVRKLLKGVRDAIRKRDLEALLAETRRIDPDKVTDEGDIRNALEAAKKALELAGEKKRAELEAHAKGLEKALGYRMAVEAARAAGAAGEWEKARESAADALGLRPQDVEASGVLDRAEKELNRPKEASTQIGIDFVLVRGGESRMGADAAAPDERPVHTVRLKGFYIGRTEVTNAQYEKFDRRHAKRRGKYSKKPNDPVVNVSWHAAVKFCEWLCQTEGRRYRLPTEAEWEFAARGKTDRVYPWGDQRPSAGGSYRANYGDGESKSSWAKDGFAYVAPVGSFGGGASPFGCLDMAGNVWEWCSDWYGPYRSAAGVVENPTGPSSGRGRVIRGGSWYHDAESLRVTNRWSKAPNKMSSTTGFRVVMEAE